MESKQDLRNHPADDDLAAFWNPALGTDALERLAVHLDSCSSCRARLERMEPALSELSRCLDAVHAQVPWQRKADFEIPAEFEIPTDRPAPVTTRRQFSSWRLVWASSIAALVVAGVGWLSLNGSSSSEQRAETLLAQASARPARNRAHHRLRIRTQTALFVRTVPDQKEVSFVRARFDEANYDWRDPLSVQSYSTWRHTLKHKTSTVSTPVGEPQQKIETATDEGTLSMASLTLDAQLAPVSGLFQFSDQQWVEITAMPDADPTPADLVPAPVPAPSATGTGENVPREPLAERELDVRLAINVLHTGASEPIEVSTSSGDILVTAYHLTADQERALALSLKPISGVTLHVLNVNEQPQPGSPLRDGTEILLQTSQDFTFEAHSLAELADRFQTSVEATLSESAQRKLWDLRASHVRELNGTLAKLEQKLQQASPDFHPPSGDSSFAHGSLAQNLANSSSALDRQIITLYAAGEPKAGRTATWSQIANEFATLKSLAKEYSRSIEEGRKRKE